MNRATPFSFIWNLDTSRNNLAKRNNKTFQTIRLSIFYTFQCIKWNITSSTACRKMIKWCDWITTFIMWFWDSFVSEREYSWYTLKIYFYSEIQINLEAIEKMIFPIAAVSEFSAGLGSLSMFILVILVMTKAISTQEGLSLVGILSPAELSFLLIW